MSFRAVLHTTEAWIKTDQFKEGHSLVGNVVVNHDEGGRGMKVDEDKIQMAQTEGDEFIQSSLRGRSAKHENMYTRKSNTSTIRTVNQTTSPNADSVSSDPAQRLLDAIKKDREQIDSLQNYDGKGQSPVASADFPTRIDEADQFTEDNWIARSQDLIRNAGKLPMNAEPKLDKLFGAGLVTPNALHYVRNHGAVPHLLWDTHKLSVLWGQTKDFSMDSLKQDFHPINIPVVFACDGNRRKELNMILRSKGFDWGPAAVSCAYWKGALLRDVLLKAQGSEAYPREGGPRLWVHFEGAETLPQGKYGTSIPLDHVMDPTNDVLLAYEMNDALLPPDHGFPLRVIIPGHVGGRLVKWLSKIWVSDKESDNWYHLNDNRVLPPFIKDGDSDAAKAYFQHPDSACYEQNLNSVIAKPGLNEQVPLKDIAAKATYRVQGYAYNGGGQEIQRVEISLDGGRNWQFCVRQVILHSSLALDPSPR
jgi:nitrate reductase (NAD(P)H)